MMSRGSTRRSGPFGWRLVAPCLVAALLMSACASESGSSASEPTAGSSASSGGSSGSSSGGSAGSSEGLPIGASKEDFIAAFADVDPIKIIIPTTGPKGALTSEGPEAYANALQEWSGGKISVEIGYGNSVATMPEAGNAILDGRAQFGLHVPIYEPDAFPAVNAVIDLMFMAEVSPMVGLLQQYGAALETAWETEEIVTELEKAGFAPMIPIGGGSPGVGLLCKELPPTSLDEMKGLQARVSGRAHVDALKELGITPVSLNITEIYEGLQRGLIDCGEMLLGTAHATGALEVAKNFTISEEVGFPATPVSHSASGEFWEDLPLIARQLMWDRLDVYLEAFVVTTIRSELDAVKTLRDGGGVIESWDAEVVERLRAHNAKTLDNARKNLPGINDPEALVDRMEETYEKWLKIVTEELGYKDGGSLFDLPNWYSEEEVDFMPFVERLMAEVLHPRRPA